MIKLLDTSINKFQINVSVLLLRLAAGALMLTHGIPKLLKLIAGGEIVFADPIGLGSATSLTMAMLAEVLGSVLIIFGLVTRFAAFALAFTMAVAAFIVHADDPFARKELGLLYLLIFIVLMITGSGKYSLDYSLFSKKHS